jgi:AraC family transcriptional regulator of adaptative response / DNA-3-methyladenine glycosylase II
MKQLRPAGDSRLDDPVFARRYRAMQARDTRFDGQFITGVHSTGIYCRPSCPATTPKPSNVSFYLTSAAAHAAGLRACKRCLPDAVPGSPEWNIRDDLAARAMRLIADGVVEREGVPGLAGRLGYTPRHLGRVLVSELGAGPLALARAHRAQTARLLLTATDLPITDVAFAAGFGSVRQFNETMTAVYGLAPRAIKERGTHAAPPMAGSTATGEAATISLRLPARAPFDHAGVLGFLGRRAVAGMDRWQDGRYERTLRLPHGAATIGLSAASGPGAPAILCDARIADVADLATLVSRVRRLLDLDADAQAIDDALAADPALRRSVASTPGIRVPGSVDADETVFRALIGQQVSVASATTALRRLVAELGEEMPSADGELCRLFPRPEVIAAHGVEVLRGPRRRIETIVRVASALADGSLRLDVGEAREDFESRLTAIQGIGPWTSGYLALRVLGSPDVLLTDDLALRNGAGRLGLPTERRELAAYAARWSPWRSYAGMHLWRAA